MSLAEDILGIDDLKRERVLVPEWSSNGEPLVLWVHTIPCDDLDRFEQEVQRDKKGSPDNTASNVRARLIAWTTFDDAGNRVFGEEHIQRLGQKGSKAVNRLFDVAARLNHVSESDIEELVKNSAETPSDDSHSG